MKVRAASNNSFLQRFLLVAIVCFGFGLWSLYDGFIAYPNELLRSTAYYELEKQIADQEAQGDQTGTQFYSAWEAKAEEKGWSLAKPKKKPEEIESDITWQYGMAIVSFLVGIPVLINYLRSRNSWVECDATTLRSSWGTELDFKQIKELDKKKWHTKGIAKIWYEKDGGEQKFVLDDFKYDRSSMDQIIRQIESNLDRDKIVNGPTQAEHDLEMEQQEKAEAELEESESVNS